MCCLIFTFLRFPSIAIYKEVSLICVSALWGVTNPIMKKNSEGMAKIKKESGINQFWSEIKYLFLNLKYLLPFGFNQLGSLLYFLTLEHVDLTLSVPMANSLTFVFTAISGCCLGEQLPSKRVVFGVFLILFGTVLCCYDKVHNGTREIPFQEEK